MDAAVVETKDALEALRRRWDAQPLAKATRNPGPWKSWEGFVCCILVVDENSMGNLALGCRLLDVAELNPLHLDECRMDVLNRFEPFLVDEPVGAWFWGSRIYPTSLGSVVSESHS